MTDIEALQIIESALNQAFIKGTFNLVDSKFIIEALKTLKPESIK